MPDPNSLVGTQKLAALNSNTATRHILDGSLYMYRAFAQAITYRVSDILEYADFKDEFVNQIGKYNVSILGEISDLYIYDFGIFIELAPDEEQRAQLEQNIQMALQKGSIDLEDAIDIRELRNLKTANQLLKLKRKTKQDREDKLVAEQQAMQAQQAMQQQQAQAQIQAQGIQMALDQKLQIIQAQSQADMQKMQGEAQLKAGLMDREFQINMQLRGAEEAQLGAREQKREDAKSNRISQQNSEQSKLINQRKNNLPPMKFESNEDSMDGFNFSEFNPR